jgi:hypothetical protein
MFDILFNVKRSVKNVVPYSEKPDAKFGTRDFISNNEERSDHRAAARQIEVLTEGLQKTSDQLEVRNAAPQMVFSNH